MKNRSANSVRHKYCLGCGYILDGLPTNRCPECGRAFDERDPSTFRTENQTSSGTCIGVVCLALSLAGLFLFYLYLDRVVILSLLAFGIEGVVLAIGAVQMLRHGTPRHPVMVVAMLVALYAIVNALTIPRLY